MLGLICSLLWDSPIPLGRLTPYVLGGMLGRWPHKVRSGGKVNGMLCSGSGGKPLTTRGHTNESKRLEAGA